MPFTVGGHGR